MMLLNKDLHIHATSYNAFPTTEHSVADIVEECVKVGLDYAGILEHLNNHEKHPLYCIEDMVSDFRNLNLPDNFFIGVEADLNSDGSDSCGMSNRLEFGLDYVIGSVHLGPQHFSRVEDYIDEEFKIICMALENNEVIDIIGHPWVQGIRWERNGSISQWDFSMVPESCQDKIIDLASANNIALEVNNLQEIIDRDFNYMKFLTKLYKSKVKISVGSDAHSKENIEHSISRTGILEKIGFKDEQIWIPAGHFAAVGDNAAVA